MERRSQRFEKFHATRLYRDMLSSFAEHVPIQARQLRSRTVEGCFSGRQAVDSLYQCLLLNQHNITKEVTRDKARKLCELWLCQKVLVPVKESVENLCDDENNKLSADGFRFADTNSVMYRLSDVATSSPRPLRTFVSPTVAPLKRDTALKRRLRVTPENCRRKAVQAGILPLEVIHSSVSTPKLKHLVFSPGAARRKRPTTDSFLSVPQFCDDNDVFMSSPRSPSPRAFVRSVLRSISPGRRATTYSRLSGTSSSSSSEHSSRACSIGDLTVVDNELDELDEVVLHDAALFRLLTLVDIPILDGILHFRDKYLNPNDDPVAAAYNQEAGLLGDLLAKMSLGASKKRLPASEVQKEIGIDTIDDNWVRSGLACLPHTWDPALVKEMQQHAGDDAAHFKGFLLNKVCENYRRITSNKTHPLIPQHYDQLVTATYEQLLAKQRYNAAIEACQLLLLVLPDYRRHPLSSLLKFLCSVQDTEKSIRIDDDLSNIDAALNQLGPFVLKSAELSAAHVRALLEFMVSNCSQLLGSLSHELKCDLWNRQRRSLCDSDEPAEPGVTYCLNRVAAEDYSSWEATEVSLIMLLNSVIDSTSLTLEEKKAHASKFKAAYPETYENHFKNLKW